MTLARFWHHNLRWVLIIWVIASVLLRTGLLIFGVGVAVWLLIVYLTAPGVFWTYVYALPVYSMNPKRTVRVLQKAISYKPLIPLPYTVLGVAYVRAKRYQEAIPILEEAIRLEKRKSVSGIKTVLAIAYRETGQYEKTYALLDELVGQGVRNLKIYYNYGLCFLRQDRLDEALKAVETARTFNIDQIEPVLLLGKINFAKGDMEAAKENWVWTVRRNEYLVEPYYWLGRAELELGQTQAAVEHFRLAVDKIHNDPLLSEVTLAEAQEWLKKAETGKK